MLAVTTVNRRRTVVFYIQFWRHYLKIAPDCKAAGVKPFHRHALRHFSASRLLEAGASLKEIQEILGHSDSRTTEIYLHNLRQGRAAKVELMKGLESIVKTELHEICTKKTETGNPIKEVSGLTT